MKINHLMIFSVTKRVKILKKYVKRTFETQNPILFIFSSIFSTAKQNITHKSNTNFFFFFFKFLIQTFFNDKKFGLN